MLGWSGAPGILKNHNVTKKEILWNSAIKTTLDLFIYELSL